MTADPPAISDRIYTVTEYFEIEYASDVRYEYVGGRVLAMSGGTYAHDKISTNFVRQLGNRLEGSQCSASGPNLRIRYGRKVNYGYADALVICGEPKFDLYRDIDSLNEYVIAWQTVPVVHVITRQPSGGWLLNQFSGMESTAMLTSLNIELPLKEIYLGVTFPEPDPDQKSPHW